VPPSELRTEKNPVFSVLSREQVLLPELCSRPSPSSSLTLPPPPPPLGRCIMTIPGDPTLGASAWLALLPLTPLPPLLLLLLQMATCLPGRGPAEAVERAEDPATEAAADDDEEENSDSVQDPAELSRGGRLGAQPPLCMLTEEGEEQIRRRRRKKNKRTNKPCRDKNERCTWA